MLLGVPSGHNEHNKLPEEQAGRVLCQLCMGLSYTREQGPLAHRNLKLANVLVKSADPLTIAITDFRMGKLTPAVGRRTAGLRYMAPEADLGSRRFAGGHAADVYSLGVVALRIFTGRLLRRSGAGEEKVSRNLMRKIGDIEDPLLRELVLSCLKWNPAERIKKRDLLRHPYFLQKHMVKVLSFGEIPIHYFCTFQEDMIHKTGHTHIPPQRSQDLPEGLQDAREKSPVIEYFGFTLADMGN